MEWIVSIVTILGGILGIVEFWKRYRVGIVGFWKKICSKYFKDRAEEHHPTEAGNNATPATVRIYTLGPHDSFGTLSWTREYSEAKEQWDAFWQSHSVGQAGFATSSADYLMRYRELYPHCSIGSKAGGESQSLETTPPIPEASSEEPSDFVRRILRQRETNIEFMPSRYTHRNFDGFDEQGVGFKDIYQDQLSDYFPPIPQIR